MQINSIQKTRPNQGTEQRQKFLSKFKWDDSLFQHKGKEVVQQIFVEYNDIFARHKLDIWVNQEFKVKMMPEVDNSVNR